MINPHATNAIKELASLGVKNLTANEIVELHILGEKYQAATAQVDCVVTSIPVRAGNCTFYPLTSAGADFMDAAFKLLPERSGAKLNTLAYTLAHCRDSEKMAVRDGREIAENIQCWAKTVTATEEEITLACQTVFDMLMDTQREKARQAYEIVLDWMEQTATPEAVNNVIELCENIFACSKKPENEHEKSLAELEEMAQVQEYQRWERYCCELAAMTGTDPESWYHKDRRLMTHSYAVAVEAMAIKAGGGMTGKDKLTARQKETMLALRGAIKRIYESRKKAIQEEKQA